MNMPREISNDLKAHLAGEVLTVATCLRIQAAGGSELFFTDHDAEIGWDADTYTPVAAGDLSSFVQSAGGGVDHMDLEVGYAAAAFTRDALRAGLWDNAEWWSFLINYADTTMGILKLGRGRLGDMEIGEHRARIELCSMSIWLQAPVGRILTPECDATLGDSRCKVAIASYTHTGTVASVTDNRTFTVSGNAAGKAANYYAYGKLRWITGANAGLYMQVKSSDASNGVVLQEPMALTVAAGDTLWLYAGCDRRKATCISRFSNILNFQGAPDLPGLDKTLVIPSNRFWIDS
jgi:uncharacterized phage protein (TIGR02218 family)